MSIILLTERNKEVIHRFLDLYYDESIQPRTREELATEYAINDSNIVNCATIANGLKIILERDVTFHEEHCAVADCPEESGCECDLHCATEFKIKYNDNTLYFKTISIRKGEDQKEHLNIPIEQLKEIISAMTDFKMCQCGEKATKDIWCKLCYLYRYIRTEEEGGDCSICMENEGRWLKTECGHIFHAHCFNKIPGNSSTWRRKCPLCRAITNLARFNPYDK